MPSVATDMIRLDKEVNEGGERGKRGLLLYFGNFFLLIVKTEFPFLIFARFLKFKGYAVDQHGNLVWIPNLVSLGLNPCTSANITRKFHR